MKLYIYSIDQERNLMITFQTLTSKILQDSMAFRLTPAFPIGRSSGDYMSR